MPFAYSTQVSTIIVDGSYCQGFDKLSSRDSEATEVKYVQKEKPNTCR